MNNSSFSAPPLASCFPATKAMAELYDGWVEGRMFKKIFTAETELLQIEKINLFLKENLFTTQVPNDIFKDDRVAEIDCFIFYKDLLGFDQIMIIYYQPLTRTTQDEVTTFLNYFRDQREWKKFHSLKNLSMAIGSESGELLDLFLWNREENVDYEKVENELADIVTYCIYMADSIGVDLLDAVIKKSISNNEKYTVDKSKGTAKKYNL